MNVSKSKQYGLPQVAKYHRKVSYLRNAHTMMTINTFDGRLGSAST